jgi:hypothetical protein
LLQIPPGLVLYIFFDGIMGASFSSNQLAGARSSAATPVTALPISYAFSSDNTLQFGFTATFAADGDYKSIVLKAATDYVLDTETTIASPSIVLPLKSGGSSTVTCSPTDYAPGMVATSIACKH